VGFDYKKRLFFFDPRGIAREGINLSGFDENHTICYSEFQKERKS